MARAIEAPTSPTRNMILRVPFNDARSFDTHVSQAAAVGRSTMIMNKISSCIRHRTMRNRDALHPERLCLREMAPLLGPCFSDCQGARSVAMDPSRSDTARCPDETPIHPVTSPILECAYRLLSGKSHATQVPGP